MIKAIDLYKSYDELEVLKGVSLEVAKGEVVSIVGSSGAGKSTLLHILGTLDNADKGQVHINDTAIHTLDSDKLANFRNEHIGFVFQFHHLLPEFNAQENVCMPAFIAGKNEDDSRQRAIKLLDFLGLSDRLHHKPNELSGGEQQRVAVARALMNEPDVIFADEPSGNLDTESSKKLHQLFFDLRNEFQQTFVIVTHNPELADMADRKIVMVDGRLSKDS